MLNNGQDEKLDRVGEEQGADLSPAPGADPWAEAFAALEAPDTDDAAEPSGAEPVDGATGDPRPANPEVGSGDGQPPVGDLDDSVDGGSVPDGQDAGGSDGSYDESAIQETLTTYTKQIEERAIAETAQLFLDRADDQGRKLIRQTDGKLGATINDPDIYRVDPQTGAAQFYNPDTGRPFTGDNPRAQAKAWVDAYNEELRETFNNFAESHRAKLEQEAAPVVELLKFMPTYKKLDPVRQQMLDALIEDYEVYDEKGETIGYSVDLNKALAQVNKQVAAIKKNSVPKAPPTGPAVDMRSSGSGNTVTDKDFKSLAAALEATQDEQLRKLNNR